MDASTLRAKLDAEHYIYDDSLITTLLVALQLGRQGQVGSIVLGGDDQPRGIPVNAVDDARPQGSVDSGEGISTVI